MESNNQKRDLDGTPTSSERATKLPRTDTSSETQHHVADPSQPSHTSELKGQQAGGARVVKQLREKIQEYEKALVDVVSWVDIVLDFLDKEKKHEEKNFDDLNKFLKSWDMENRMKKLEEEVQSLPRSRTFFTKSRLMKRFGTR